MASVNKIHLLGNLGKDPDYKTFEGDKQKVSFSIATSEKWGDKVITQWHNCVIWGKLAKIAADYLKKGSPVYLEGKVTYREYEKDGDKKFITEIVCDSMQMLGKAPEKTEKPATESDDPFSRFSEPAKTKSSFTGTLEPEQPDDLPFILTVPFIPTIILLTGSLLTALTII